MQIITDEHIEKMNEINVSMKIYKNKLEKGYKPTKFEAIMAKNQLDLLKIIYEIGERHG